MKEIRLSDQFIEFEKKNNLFNLTDNNGTYIWDIIRFDLYINLMWDFNKQPVVKKNYKNTFRLYAIQIIDFLSFKLNREKYDNFFYLCSRNEKQGLLFDQNVYSVLEQFDQKKTLKLETTISEKNKLLFHDSFYYFPQFLHRKVFKSHSEFDYSTIIDKVSREFGACPFRKDQLASIVHNFYSDKSFFKKLFSKKEVKNIFLTQNGVQKGLLSAAAELNIPTYEFQHGIVDDGHLVYNYPVIEFKKCQVYLPDVIFSLSEYWFLNVNIPFTKIYPLGNDFFSKEVGVLSDSCTAITVISANVFGIELEEFIMENIHLPVLAETTIYFKLHPNQFHDKEYYQTAFKAYQNVKVIADEYSVLQLLEKSRTLLTIQSTAVYEALQSGRKVILLKKSTYNRHYDLFNNANVHVINSTDDLIDAINLPVNEVSTRYFTKFDNSVLQEVLLAYNKKKL